MTWAKTPLKVKKQPSKLVDDSETEEQQKKKEDESDNDKFRIPNSRVRLYINDSRNYKLYGSGTIISE